MEKIQEFVAPHYDWFQGEVVPPVVEFWHRLDVPAWDIYREAAHTCGKDFMQSSQSTWKLLYLTFRPIAILSWILFQVLLGIGNIIFRLLLEKGWLSLRNGALQVKAGSIWFYQFQRSLSRTEVLGELGVIGLGVLFYYLRQWLKRQTYVTRATKWCHQKKRHVIKVRVFPLFLFVFDGGSIFFRRFRSHGQIHYLKFSNFRVSVVETKASGIAFRTLLCHM
jgi:hypothetical protein